MNKKINKELLNEELKKFNLLNEYDFYIGEEEDEIENGIIDEEGDEDLPIDDLPDDDSQTANGGGDDISDLEGGEEMTDDAFDNEELPEEPIDNQEIPEEPMTDLGAEEIPEEPIEDEVELDITELVSGTEEAKQSADMANQKLDQLMGALDQLDQKMSSMDGITNKIDNLENELEKRAPTPDEKLEMRSLDSYPYNLKLTDFWSEKEGQYDVMGVNDKNDTEEKSEEYTLTTDDINSDYNETSIKSTFNDSNEYEEEDIM